MPSLATTVALVSGLLPTVLAQAGVPLASKSFEWANLPYQADTDDGERGRQWGYNLCNSTTEGQDSLCQTAVINSIDDFCLWGPPEPDSLVGNVEGESVAWCTKPGHGTRLIPEGALTGVQFIRTPDYIQVTGWITQQYVNIEKDDSGGELDPHGADQRGNPLGGLVFSNAWGAGPDGTEYKQVIEWHNFMGGSQFCLKACDPARADAARYCEHIFDRIGCAYNAPAAYEDGVFLSCLGESQDFPGIYTGEDGVVTTYQQPPESLGEISTMPYQPRIPATSSCTTYESASLYANQPTPTNPVTSSVSTTRVGASLNTNHAVATSTHTSTATDIPDGASRSVVSIGALFGAALLAAIAL